MGRKKISRELGIEIGNTSGTLRSVADRFGVSCPTVDRMRKRYGGHKDNLAPTTPVTVKTQTYTTLSSASLASDLQTAFTTELANPNDAKLIPNVDSNYIFRGDAFNIAADLIANVAVMMVGMPGTGKTTLIEQLAALAKVPLLSVSCFEGMTVADLVGGTRLINNQTVWVDGPLTTAMRHGYWFLIDEFDYAESGVLGALNKVTDEVTVASPTRKLTLPENGGEVVVAHPNFRIAGTANSIGNMQKHRRMFPNTRPMNFAQLERWNIYQTTWMSKAEEVALLCNYFKVGSEHKSYFNKFIELAEVTREAFSRGEGEMSFPVTTRRLIKIVRYLQRNAPDHDRKNMPAAERVLDGCKALLFPVCNDVEVEALKGYIRRLFA